MTPLPSLRHLLRDYFPTFLGTVFAALVAIACGVPLIIDRFFAGASLGQQATASFFAVLVLALVLAHCNFMILRGRPHWVRGVVLVYVLCLLGSLASFFDHPDLLIFALAVCSPLLGLLLLNSQRHRDLRGHMLEARRQREARSGYNPRRKSP